MGLLPSLCLLLNALVRVSIQQCTIEEFENRTALDLLQSTLTDASQKFTIDIIYYNCLSASQIIGLYSSPCSFRLSGGSQGGCRPLSLTFQSCSFYTFSHMCSLSPHYTTGWWYWSNCSSTNLPSWARTTSWGIQKA